MSLLKKTFVLGETTLDCWVYIVHNSSSNDEFWFKAKDIALFLGYKNSRDAILKNVYDIWRKTWSDLAYCEAVVSSDHLTDTPHTSTSADAHTQQPDDASVFDDAITDDDATADDATPARWQPHTIFISEPGLYALLTRSKKPEAVRFTRWIYEEVLPSLRKTGTYSLTTITDESNKLLELKTHMLELKVENMELALVKTDVEKQLAMVKSDAEKQLALVKSDAEKQLALVTSESEKLMLLTRMTNTETVRQLQNQFNESEGRYKLLEARAELETQRLKSLARMSVMEFAVHGLLARDNIEQNEMLKSTLKRLAPRVVPEVKNPQHQDHVAVYRYTRQDVTYFKVARGQLRYIEGLDGKIAKFQLPINDRSRLKKHEQWVINAVRLFKSPCSNSTRCWAKFKQTNLDFIYGTYLFNAATTLRFLSEPELRAKYQLDLRNSQIFDDSELPDYNMPDATLEFRELAFVDEDDAVARCLTPYLSMSLAFVGLFERLIERLNTESCAEACTPTKRTRDDYTPVDVRTFLDNVTPSSSRASTPNPTTQLPPITSGIDDDFADLRNLLND